jgi:tRNA-2-methylthio-N6-dimethylallyladenosine synthase
MKMKYHIITYGCQMNKNDSERIAAQLEKRGYQPAQTLKQADLIVINVCSVRQSAIDRVYAKINQIKNTKYEMQDTRYKIILTGCLLKKDREKLKNQVDQIWPPCDLITKPKHSSLSQAYVPIMTGCNNFCSYCVVPYTRGREYSRPAKEIIKEVKDLIKKGYKEIVLLGQNVNSYKSELRIKNQKSRINFPGLLKILNDIPGDFQIKFITSHPKDMSDKLIEAIAQCKKVVKDIHLPVQSGDNEILKKMNRGYTVEHYKNLIKKIRQKIPKVKISTDVIVGFPGETEKQFQNTVKLFQWAKFNQAYIARYSPRSGTAAAKLKDDVPPDEKKKRRKILEEIIKNQKEKV